MGSMSRVEYVTDSISKPHVITLLRGKIEGAYTKDPIRLRSAEERINPITHEQPKTIHGKCQSMLGIA